MVERWTETGEVLREDLYSGLAEVTFAVEQQRARVAIPGSNAIDHKPVTKCHETGV